MLLSPSNLCYDWQHGSIPLVHSIGDVRNIATVMSFVGAFLLVARARLFLFQQDVSYNWKQTFFPKQVNTPEASTFEEKKTYFFTRDAFSQNKLYHFFRLRDKPALF